MVGLQGLIASECTGFSRQLAGHEANLALTASWPVTQREALNIIILHLLSEKIASVNTSSMKCNFLDRAQKITGNT